MSNTKRIDEKDSLAYAIHLWYRDYPGDQEVGPGAPERKPGDIGDLRSEEWAKVFKGISSEKLQSLKHFMGNLIAWREFVARQQMARDIKAASVAALSKVIDEATPRTMFPNRTKETDGAAD